MTRDELITIMAKAYSGARNYDKTLSDETCMKTALDAAEAAGAVMVPDKLDSITALMIVEKMAGKWNKQNDERDTEKVKRIYQAMLSQSPFRKV